MRTRQIACSDDDLTSAELLFWLGQGFIKIRGKKRSASRLRVLGIRVDVDFAWRRSSHDQRLEHQAQCPLAEVASMKRQSNGEKIIQ